MTTGEVTEDQDDDLPTPRTAGVLVVLGLVPMLGVVLFAVAGVLGMRAFSHNNALSCGFDSPAVGSGACGTHSSYALPATLAVVALLLVIGGGAFASYYAMRNVGLPLFAALRRRGGPR